MIFDMIFVSSPFGAWLIFKGMSVLGRVNTRSVVEGSFLQNVVLRTLVDVQILG